ncbi:HSF-type DNA-binding [Seminavis robusta]|uniref:HSF-type DNA-binding n=1 Tax=Seminavis robusta TaxID=568900 RepID=A0A9N8EMW7_9STRA|nr:HSF-type DNA-binding [Seminavis robusta]|eukprot:Sro1577_g283620.1 HSF-type DNA-binding (255) ;mRNA; r:21985-22854
MPIWFPRIKFATFKRQLSLFGFARVAGGPKRGTLSHELFCKDMPDLAKEIKRRDKSSTPTDLFLQRVFDCASKKTASPCVLLPTHTGRPTQGLDKFFDDVTSTLLDASPCDGLRMEPSQHKTGCASASRETGVFPVESPDNDESFSRLLDELEEHPFSEDWQVQDWKLFEPMPLVPQPVTCCDDDCVAPQAVACCGDDCLSRLLRELDRSCPEDAARGQHDYFEPTPIGYDRIQRQSSFSTQSQESNNDAFARR